jgi:hypothetical protein
MTAAAGHSGQSEQKAAWQGDGGQAGSAAASSRTLSPAALTVTVKAETLLQHRPACCCWRKVLAAKVAHCQLLTCGMCNAQAPDEWAYIAGLPSKALH